MSTLASLQSSFQGYLLDDAGNSALKCIVDDKKVGANKRLKIYHDAYRFRIINALAMAYPKLQALLGGELFEDAARSYLTNNPSIHPNLRWYGDAMCKHLLSTLPKHPIVAELAHFEWVLSLAFDAENTPVLTIQDLAEISPERWGNLYFIFQPSTQIFKLSYNTIAIWKALDAEEMPPVPRKQATETNCLVWRQDLNAKFRSVEEIEVLALQRARNGSSFGDVCEALFVMLGDEATLQAAQYLATWLEAGLISELKI